MSCILLQFLQDVKHKLAFFYLFFAVKKKEDLINVYVVIMACQICFILREKNNIFFGIHFTIGWFGLFIEVTMIMQ